MPPSILRYHPFPQQRNSSGWFGRTDGPAIPEVITESRLPLPQLPNRRPRRPVARIPRCPGYRSRSRRPVAEKGRLAGRVYRHPSPAPRNLGPARRSCLETAARPAAAVAARFRREAENPDLPRKAFLARTESLARMALAGRCRHRTLRSENRRRTTMAGCPPTPLECCRPRTYSYRTRSRYCTTDYFRVRIR